MSTNIGIDTQFNSAQSNLQQSSELDPTRLANQWELVKNWRGREIKSAGSTMIKAWTKKFTTVLNQQQYKII